MFRSRSVQLCLTIALISSLLSSCSTLNSLSADILSATSSPLSGSSASKSFVERPASADALAGGDSKTGASGTSTAIEAGQLTAGVWSDLDNWAFWQGLMKTPWDHMESQWGYYTSQRFSVLVKQGNQPQVDAVVELKQGDQVLYTARTNNRGEAELFANIFEKQAQVNGQEQNFSITVTSGTETQTRQEVLAKGQEAILFEMKENKIPDNQLDLMFVIDTTGSMTDELSFLQAELKSVIERIQKQNGQELSIRLSANFYRDEGDDYVVRSFPFSDNISEVLKQLSSQRTAGGGDFEEAVEKALDDAVLEHQWRNSARARLLFLVLDAPPHRTTEILEKLHRMNQVATKKGIRIMPIASSGIDKETEFLLRFLSLSTDGQYIFLTNHSGIGDSHIEPTIGEYQVEKLNDLMVRLINDAVGFKTAQ